VLILLGSHAMPNTSGVLQGGAGCCMVLQGVAGCCKVLLVVAGCCSVLQCVAVCCSVLQCIAGEGPRRMVSVCVCVRE